MMTYFATKQASLGAILLLLALEVVNAQDYNYVENAISIQHQEGWDSGPSAYTTVGATYEAPQSTCVNLPNRWFTFTATGAYLKMTIYGGTISFIQYNLFSGSSYTPVGCGQAIAGQSSYTFERTDLVAGAVYYMSVASDNNGRGTFGIKVSTTKDYNYNEGALTIQHENGWNSGPEAYTTVGATFQPPQSSCTNLPNRWFKFMATDSYLKLTIYGGTITLIQHNLFMGSNYIPASCGQATAGSSTYTFEKTNLTVGATYYLSIASDNNGKGTFGISMQSGRFPNYWTLSANILHPVNLEHKVGIGVSSVPDEYKVAIQGKVLAEGVKVQLQSKWPDYVFGSAYDLLPLAKIKEYVNANNHLPEIPSAKEMEATGLELGEMNVLLLKKIEELTLYQIQLLEKLEEQNARIKALESMKQKQ